MNNLDVHLLRRCLLAGSDDAIDELLRSVKVEDLVLKLSHMDDDCFSNDDEYDHPVVPVVDNRYIGTLLVRVLDLLLDKYRLGELFVKAEVVDLLSQRVVSGRLPVRRLFARKCRLYFEECGACDDRLVDILWDLLFDSDYVVFDSCSKALCKLVGRRDGCLSVCRVNALVGKLHSGDDAECVLALRLLEFCVTLGRCCETAFKLLLDAGAYRAVFDLYMSSDVLVRLNCLEILDSCPELLVQLQHTRSIPQSFVDHGLSVLDSSSNDPSDELLVPFLFRIFVCMLRNGQLSSSERECLKHFVSRIITSSSPHKSDVTFCSALSCVGLLYVCGCMSDNLYQTFADIIHSTTKDDVLSSILDSLICICESKLSGDQVEFLVAMSEIVLKSLSRFAMSEVREHAYIYLLKAIRHDGVLNAVLCEEVTSHLFSSDECLYASTVAKKNLVREVLRRVAAVYVDSPAPISAEHLTALRRYAQ